MSTAVTPSPPPAAACPDWQTLLDYCSGRLPGPAQQSVHTHVTACTDCDLILAELSGESADDLGDRLAACLKEHAPPAESPGCRAMLEAAKAMTLPFGLARETPAFTLRETEADDAAGRTIGPYTTLKLIGHGGMGVVFLARHEAIGRLAAVKVVRAGHFAPADTLARFRTEGAAAARLRHPNIAQFYDFGEHERIPYYSMEWVGGGTLTTRLADGPLPPREAAGLVRTLAGAMAYAHGQHVIHRDLKPNNVLLDTDGTPKITDFGLAKLLDDDTPGLTATDAVLGTPSYMAPEQAEGRTAAVGAPADIYALGAILYETLTGKPAFPGQSKTDILRRVRRREILSPSAVCSTVPPALEAVCLKCLEWDPARRYASAQALADDLGRWLADEPTEARPVSRTGRAVRAVRRRWRPVAALLGLLAAIGIGAAVLGSRDREPVQPGLPEAQREAARQKLEARLASGGPVELIGATGPPAYFRIRHGEDRSTVTAPADGRFTLSTWADVCLLELVPDPRHDSYRFKVDVRHETSDATGEVGVFFAHRAFPGPGGTDDHLFARLGYNDVRRPQDVAARVPPARIPPGVPALAPDQARVRIGLGTAGPDPRGSPWDYRNEVTSGVPYTPRGIVADTWRELEIVVKPDGVECRWGGELVGRLPAAKVTDTFRRWLNDSAAKHPSPIWAKGDPAYSPRGGVGLLLRRGTASFRSAELTPLAAVP